VVGLFYFSRQHGGMKKKTPIDTALKNADGDSTLGQVGEPYVQPNQLFSDASPMPIKKNPHQPYASGGSL
jgi:hypothetical protein